MRVSGRRVSALAAAAVLTLAGCGGSAESGAQPAQSPSDSAGTPDGGTSAKTSSTPSGSPSSADDGEDSAVGTEDDAVEVEIEIEHGNVTPSGERIDVEVGQTIRFVVDSDVADEIHVHSTPEHTFGFGAGVDDREFEFKLTQPGVVEAELHELGDVVVTIAARP